MSEIAYRQQAAGAAQIESHLRACDADYLPPLSSRVAIGDYAAKIAHNARTFEAWQGSRLVGLVAAYFSGTPGTGFVTSVSVERELTGKGIAGRLLDECIEQARQAGLSRLALEVSAGSVGAQSLYRRRGFMECAQASDPIRMELSLDGRPVQ